MAICNWPEAERPREKLLMGGPTQLSDAELLAIFLRTGCAGRTAVDLARDLLKRFGGLRALLESSQEEFCEAKGLGTAKYAQLQATLEMSRRHLAETLQRSEALSSSEAVKRFVTAQIRHEPAEVFSALYLNSQHFMLGFETLFRGTIDGASVYPREVVKAALKHNCAAIIFAHNHPSGIAEPSQADRYITKQLQRALELIDVRVLDHIVVGEGEPYSFAERGLL